MTLISDLVAAKKALLFMADTESNRCKCL